MRRLYVKVYLSFVGILFVFGALASAAFVLMHGEEADRRFIEGASELLGELLPGPERPVEELEARLATLGERFHLNLSVYGPDGTPLAARGEPLPLPAPPDRESGWLRRRGGVMVELPDGRWLLAREIGHGTLGARWLGFLGLLGVSIAIGAYPVARQITRRLERLQGRVDALGAGDLATRVEVEGRDEVADLARSFNRAADRIERLVHAQRQKLATASHELRTPLARLRVAIELLARDERPEIRERAARDIAELDELIGELLLASRLDAQPGPDSHEEVEVLALLAEEASRFDVEVAGEPVRVRGDGRLLRRLVRNLLENALRYGEGGPVEASVVPLGQGARLCVADRGPGVPEEERERIFEPFYRPPGRPESAASGVGLGLALVRQIARHHGGDARCVPRDGGGTRFEVDLGVPLGRRSGEA
jgi:signal transduction histidine kinase